MRTNFFPLEPNSDFYLEQFRVDYEPNYECNLKKMFKIFLFKSARFSILVTNTRKDILRQNANVIGLTRDNYIFDGASMYSGE